MNLVRESELQTDSFWLLVFVFQVIYPNELYMSSGLPALNYKMSPHAIYVTMGSVSVLAVVSLLTVCGEAPRFVFLTPSLQSARN